MYLILVILLVLLLAGGISPVNPYWGPNGAPGGWYAPGGVVGLLLVVILILALLGRL